MKILFSGSFGADAAYGAQLGVRENIDDGDLVVVAVPTHACMRYSRKRNIIIEQELMFEDVKYEKAMEIMVDMKRNEKR